MTLIPLAHAKTKIYTIPEGEYFGRVHALMRCYLTSKSSNEVLYQFDTVNFPRQMLNKQLIVRIEGVNARFYTK